MCKDWFDYLSEWEKKNGEHYDIAGYSGCVELYRSGDRSLVGRFDMEQILIFCKSLFRHGMAYLPDANVLREELDESVYSWRVEDSNMSELEATCYMLEYVEYMASK